MARLRERADNMAATSTSLKKIADAADPLYKTLDDNQKRRLTMLTHMEGRGFGAEGWRRHRLERGMDRWERGGRDRHASTATTGRDQERSAPALSASRLGNPRQAYERPPESGGLSRCSESW